MSSSDSGKSSTGWDTNASIGCGVVIVGIGVVIWFLVSFLGGDDGDSSNADEVGAWVACQMKVDDLLKAPATAGYPLISSLQYSSDGNTYSFPRAWVDAENSFGAEIRTFFSCDATASPSGESWSVNVTLLD